MSSMLYSWLETRELETIDKVFLTNIANKMKELEWQVKYASERYKKMRKDVEDAINEADIYFMCSKRLIHE